MYSWKHMLRGAVACAVIAASSMTAFAGAPSYLEQVDPQLRPALEQNSSLDFNQAGVLEDINRRARSLVGSPDLPKDEAVHVYDVYIPRAGDSEALRLAQAGVPVEFHLYPRAYHAFEAIAKGTAYSERAIDEYVRVLNEALHP